ncbi:MAG: hypothetical protein E7337_14650 [Clostridiales bacterium]|nr:hypothetical protein [Clostridiales bacterium]
MGRKYGSLHIRLENTNLSVDVVKNSYRSVMDAVFSSDVKTVAERLGLNIIEQQLPILNSLVNAGLSCSSKQTMVEHDGFVSVSDERITFENIHNIAQKLSAIITLPVFFSSVYDDDIFIFGLCENRETISLHISGTCEAYGMTHVLHNIGVLEKYVSINENSAMKLQELCGADAERALIKAIGFQLDIK